MKLFNSSIKNGLLFLSAPAGYGKTTAVNLWTNQMDAFNVWIDLDTYDNSLASFCRSFYSALLAVKNRKLQSKSSRVDSHFLDSPFQQTLELIKGLTTKDFSTIVLDNFHIITDQTTRKSFYTLLSYLPRNICLIILTREPVNSFEMEQLCHKKCDVISEQNLAFSLEETTTFVRQFDFSLTSDTIADVQERTEGWAIAVKTLLDGDSFTTDPLSEENLIEYIKTQVWARWSPSQQNFMLKTALLDELEPEICDILTEQKNSDEVLEELCCCNPFLYKNAKQSYRYHLLFKDFLYEIAQQNLDLNQLNAKASIYYLSQNELLKGVNYAIKSNSETYISQAILVVRQNYRHSLTSYLHFAQLLNANELSESLCQKYPFLYIFRLCHYYAIGDYYNLTHYADKLANALPFIQNHFPSYSSFCFQGLVLDPRKSLVELLRRFSSLKLDRQVSTNQIRIALQQMEGQIPFFHRGIQNCGELCDPMVTKRIEALVQKLDNADVNWILEGIRCGLHCERNEQAQALTCAAQLEEALSSIEIPEIRFSVMIQIASAYFINNQPKSCNLILTQTKKYLESVDADYLYPTWLAYRTTLQLWRGHKRAAVHWLKSEFSPDTTHLYLHKIVYYFTTIRSYIVLEQYEDAIQLATLLHKLMEEFNRPLDSAEALVLKAIARNMQGNTLHAQNLLIQVLQKLKGERFITILAAEGSAVLPILKSIPEKVISEKLDSTYFNTVLKAAENFAAHQPDFHSHKINTIKLSPRQQTILFLLAKGYSYKEMMTETNLTMHTIKAHVSTLYQKFDVHDAASALAKARRIGLLP